MIIKIVQQVVLNIQGIFYVYTSDNSKILGIFLRINDTN